MKILEFCSAFPPSRGGVEMVVSELSTRLAERGHSVTVVTSTRGGESHYKEEFVGNVRVIRLPEKFHLFEAPLIPQIAIRALYFDYDILHVHGMSPSITDAGVVMAKLRGKPVVVTYHNDAESTVEWPIARVAAKAYARFSVPILSMADSVVCTTKSYAESSPTLKHFHGRFEVIPLGVDTTRFANTGLREPPTERKEVLFVGQLKDYKGVSFLIEAVARMRRDRNDIFLRIVGDGPSLPRLMALAKALGVDDSVDFVGNVAESKLVDYYDSCDLVVLPSISRREAFGLVQLEASAAGKSVVASDIPGVGDVNRLIGGFLARPSDAASLALQIEKALAVRHDGSKLKETAATMSWDVVTTEYEELFQSLLKNQGPTSLEPVAVAEPAPPSTVSSDPPVFPQVLESYGEKGRNKTKAQARSAINRGFETVIGWFVKNGYVVMGAVAAILVSLYLVASLAIP